MTAPALTPKVVLIVEDDPDISAIMQFLLESEQHTVHCLADVTPGEASALHADLIIMDLWLKEKNGGDLCHALKANPATAGIPVVLCSAINDLSTIQQRCTADAILEKPFDLETFNQIVKQFLPPA